MMRALARWYGASLLVAGSLVASYASAQEIRGLVMMPDGLTPASGVVVVLFHATKTDSIVARSVTNDRGRFAMQAPPRVPGVLRLLRIGYEPMDAGKFALASGEVVDGVYTLQNRRVVLAAYDTRSATRCEVQPKGAQLVAQLFEQARTALIAATTPLSGTVTTRSISYDRQQDRRQRVLGSVQRRVMVNATTRPYASIGADSLDKVGYRVRAGSDAMFYAPDADVLMSDVFLREHCLHLVNSRDSLAELIGIGFRPVASRGNYVDIEGTLWLDRRTSALQFLEFSYTSLPDYLREEKLGGRVDYAQFPTGDWFISEWNIVMPMLNYGIRDINISTIRSSVQPMRVTGFYVTGGAVQDISTEDRVLYLNTDAAHAGLLPTHDLKTVTAAINETKFAVNGDSGTVRSFCGTPIAFDHAGLISGRVLDEVGMSFGGASVFAVWKEDLPANGGVPRFVNREVNTSSSDAGVYLLCGIALRRTVTVFTKRGENQWGNPTYVRVTERAPAAQVDLRVDPPIPHENEAPKPRQK